MSVELEEYRGAEGSGGGPRPPNRTLRTLGIAVFIGALFLLAYLGVQWLADSVNEVIGGDEPAIEPGLAVTLEIAPGEPASQIARDLADAGVVSSAADFDRVVREARASNRLQAGSYELTTGMDEEDVLAILIAGPETGDVYRITVVEGLTVGQTLDSLADQTGFTFDELAAPLLDGTVTSDLLGDDPEELHDWEGLLFPDTYEFATDATPEDILGLMAATAEDRIAAVDWSGLEDRGLTPYDGVIIASLIEEEVGVEEDRPLVASVILNRLDAGMKLQLDVTIVYALGGAPEGGLTAADLEVNSPYNTYLIDGLPPTPIAGVRSASLRAAADPAESGFLFFIATDDSGKMTFTETFEEFLQIQEELASEDG